MIKKEAFEITHIKELANEKRCDPILLERSIYAFGLLESLVRVNMPFIFKGGHEHNGFAETPSQIIYRYRYYCGTGNRH